MTAFNVAMLLTADASQARRELKGAEAEVIRFGNQARQTGEKVAAGFDRAEAEILQFRRAANGTTTNLISQFNDIGVMMAAGQSPLLLAAQQGTQISQALGPLGARGAVQALGSAFLGLLNPVNFAIFGAVAAFGALGGILQEIFAEGKSFEEQLKEVQALVDELNQSTRNYKDAAKASAVSIRDLKIEYGDLADEIARARDQMERLTLAQAGAEQNFTVDDFAGRVGGRALELIGPADIASLDALIERIDLAQIKLSDFRGADRQIFYQLNALKELSDQYGITAEQALRLVEKAALLENSSGTKEMAKAASALAEELEKSIGSAEGVDAVLPGILSGLAAIVEQAGEMSNALGFSADEARRLADNIRSALAVGLEQKGQLAPGATLRGLDDERGSQAAGLRDLAIWRTSQQLEAMGLNSDGSPRRTSGGRSGGGRASSRQADGAEKLIASLQRELDILRETDPVQKEMIRNREALSGATAEERAKVEELITAKQREVQAQKQAQDAWEFSKNTAYDALDALILQGESATEVMANLANAIAKALLQSALLGTGPLAGIFGGQGTGLFDVIGGVFGAPAKADGGFMIGPGGPRDDKILARLSNGEFVVNAAATARHRPLLEQINRAPAFADGGFVGGGGAGAAFGQGGRGPIEIMLTLSDDINARIVKVSEGVSVRTVKAGLQHYDAKVLPVSLQKVQGDPRRVG